MIVEYVRRCAVGAPSLAHRDDEARFLFASRLHHPHGSSEDGARVGY